MLRFKLLVINLFFLCLLIPHYARATSLLEETYFIIGTEGVNYDFVADQTPLLYEVFLTDFEVPAAFDFLGVTITTSTDVVAQLLAPGMTTFNAELGTKYFANVFGIVTDPPGAGLFGILVQPTSAPVPEPATMLLFGSGLFGLAVARIRKKKK